MEKRYLAIDLGASSGRVMCGVFDEKKLRLEELLRFENNPVSFGGHFYWNVLELFHDIKRGLRRAAELGFESLSIDTWGVDYALLDKQGGLLGNPYHYRDSRVNGILPDAFVRVPAKRLYEITGNEIMEINTAFQLLSDVSSRSDVLSCADGLLLMPDLLGYMLTGVKCAETSIASTTQLLDAKTGEWSEEILSKFGIPARLMPPIVPSGTKIGTISAALREELNLPCADVIAGCGHDTQCAMAATPTEEDDFIFISCGTWSLFGTELDAPRINEKTAAYNITNERGYDGKTSFLKNITGLWLIQETRRYLAAHGEEYSYAQLEQFALSERAFAYFIDPVAPEFVPTGNMPERIRNFCKETQQGTPCSVGAVMRCIYESIAMKFAETKAEIEDCTGKRYDTIHILGGGAKDGLLCQMTANACNATVIAGPVEATAYGNVAIQLLASGEVSSLRDARALIADSVSLKTFTPQEDWSRAFQTYLDIIHTERKK